MQEFHMGENSKQRVVEFTRRKNWSQSILDAIRDVILVLSDDLQFIHCSNASSEILGYKSLELVGRLFTDFIHVNDVDEFLREFLEKKSKAQIFRMCIRFLRKDGKYTVLEIRGQFKKNCFFGNARRIPTESTHSIDTILDYKIENELLTKKLAVLKLQHKLESQKEKNPRVIESEVEDSFNNSLVYALGVDASYNMGESLSLFTGLNYDMGERSYGISSGMVGGELKNEEKYIKRDQESKEKVRACTDCGVVDTPGWRKGSNGINTLCNACGLRWAKRQKQNKV